MIPDPWPRTHISGIILNGGASRRLGRDKALVHLAGRTLLERTLDRLGELFDEVLVVGRPEACPKHPALTRAVADTILGSGPLGGIYTGLLEMSRPYGFFVACDMPLLDGEVVRRQIAALRSVRRTADALVPAWTGESERTAPSLEIRHSSFAIRHSSFVRQASASLPSQARGSRLAARGSPFWEPLHALYSQDCLPAARRQLATGDYRIRGFFDSVRVLFWDARAAGVDPRVFTNVNTKSDLARLAGQLGSTDLAV